MLIVEDDLAVGTGLQDFFEMEGYAVTRVLDGEDGLQQITSLPPYDIVLLDVMLPKKNGFDVLREARRMGVGSPVIVLTARDSQEERLQGFELGADDYVTKPFDAEELGARVKAVLRRSHTPADASPAAFRFGDVVIDFDDQTATVADEEVPFTTLEFDILRYFIQHRGRTISRKQLLRDVWGISGDITTRTIDRHVASIRKKIEPVPQQPRYIETVYGIGYKFVGDDGEPVA
ncbi:MAG: response regulator [Bacteroidetes bacterium]|nr:response regulator [Bacteroidota bacterium]